MNAEQMVKTITRLSEEIKEKDDLISKLVHLLAGKSEENEILQAALAQMQGDEDFVVFSPDFESTH